MARCRCKKAQPAISELVRTGAHRGKGPTLSPAMEPSPAGLRQDRDGPEAHAETARQPWTRRERKRISQASDAQIAKYDVLEAHLARREEDEFELGFAEVERIRSE